MSVSITSYHTPTLQRSPSCFSLSFPPLACESEALIISSSRPSYLQIKGSNDNLIIYLHLWLCIIQTLDNLFAFVVVFYSNIEQFICVYHKLYSLILFHLFKILKLNISTQVQLIHLTG